MSTRVMISATPEITELVPLRIRRQTASMNPLSNVTTSSSVYATHLSNLTLRFRCTFLHSYDLTPDNRDQEMEAGRT